MTEVVRDVLEEVLAEDLLTRERRKLAIIGPFVEDTNYIAEGRDANTPKAKLLGTARIVAERFGTVLTLPHRLGSTGAVHVVVDSEVGGTHHKIRLKGFGELPSIIQNVQHLRFLFEMKELGYSAAVGCGPYLENPLYLVMLEGQSALHLVLQDTVAEGTPRTLREILELFGQYALNKPHFGPTEYIPKHLELIRTRLLDVIRGGRFAANGQNEERKNYWTLRISEIINHIKTKVYVGKEPSTWVVSDALLENIVRLGNDDSNSWVFIDQGVYQTQLDAWRASQSIAPDSPDYWKAQWFGRIEYNLGQMYHSLVRYENVNPEFTKIFGGAIHTMIKDGRLEGVRARELPAPHNPTLSHVYFFLGILTQQIINMAYASETADKTISAERVADIILTGIPYTWDRQTLGLPSKVQ